MDAFQLWYTYYDSIFLTFPIQIPYSLFTSINFSNNLSMGWPQTKKIPQLSSCFEILQKFILNQKNWIKSNCDSLVLGQIQKKINSVLILLLMQKSYGKDFWFSYKRRIQASIIHFFIILKKFVLSLIPEQFNTLSQAIKNGSSCISLPSIQVCVFIKQSLVNELLLKIEKLRQFILGKQFKEERGLVNQFLLQFKDFLQNLPFFTKKKLQIIPQITKYIQIINPIELYKDSYQIKLKRKKANTYANNRQSLKIKSLQDQQKKRISFKNNNESNLFYYQKCKSSHQIYVGQQNCFNSQIQILDKRKEKQGFLTIFKFNDFIRKHSINYGKKKLTIASQTTKQANKSGQRKASFISLSKADKLKSNQRSLKKLKTSSFTNRSKKSSQYIILHQNIQKQNQNERKIVQVIKKFKSKDDQKKKENQEYNFWQGKCKKWGVVRDYVNKNIAKKKIQSLIQEEVFL